MVEMCAFAWNEVGRLRENEEYGLITEIFSVTILSNRTEPHPKYLTGSSCDTETIGKNFILGGGGVVKIHLSIVQLVLSVYFVTSI